MTVVERQVRELGRLGVAEVWVFPSAATRSAVTVLRGDLTRLFGVRVAWAGDGIAADLPQALAQIDEPVLLLHGDVIYDERVFAQLAEAADALLIEGPPGTAAARLSAAAVTTLARQWQDGCPWETQISPLGVVRCGPADIEAYIPSLRLTMPPLIEPVPAVGALGALERLMYRRSFKGAIDVVARYGYYHLVRLLTRWISPTRLTPNLFTVLSVLGVWAAAPCLATGRLGWGLAAAWLGVLCDSIDGKLARLRLHLSESMGAFEHLTAMPGLALWYLGTGWHLTGGRLLAADGVALVTWLFLAAFVLDKVVTGLFRSLSGRELFDAEPVDAAFHWIAGRRNISLVLLTLGVAADQLAAAFTAAAVWTGVTLVFHVARFSWLRCRREAAAGS
jgi:phosphatidylglycerophosphate synthase